MDLPAETTPDSTSKIAAGDPHHPKTDSGKRLVRGSALLLVGRLISILARLTTQVLIVRYLSRRDYGGFAYALAVIVPIQSVMTLGLDRSVARFVPIFHEQRQYRRFFGTITMTIVVILLSGLLITLTLYGFRGLIAKFVHDDQAMALLLVLIFLAPIQALDEMLNNLFAVFAKPRAIFFRRYVLAPGLKLAVVVGFILSHSNVFFLAVGYILSSLLGLLIYGYFFVKELSKQGLFEHWSLRDLVMPWREVLSFSIPILTTELVSMNTMSVVVLEYFWGTKSVAGFRAVFPVSKLSELVTSSFVTLFTPTAARMFAKDDRAGISHLYWRTALWMAVASFPIFAVTFSLAQPLTLLLFGLRYAQSAPILSMLSLGYYVNAAFGFNALTLQVFGKIRYILILNLSTVVVNFALSLLLVPRFGALGAGIATMVAVIIYNISTQLWLWRATGVGIIEWPYVKAYLAIGLSALGLLAIQMTLGPPIYVSLVLALLLTLFVVRFNARLLEVDKMFPELLRVPGVRFLVGDGPR